MPYIPTYARQLGVPSSGVGIMYAILPFVGLMAKPSFGALADKFKKGKTIFLSAIALTALFFASIAFIPPKSADTFMELECNGVTTLKTCNVTDECVLDKLEMEFFGVDVMECKLVCSDLNYLFLQQMCNEWNYDEACTTNLTSIEMTTYSNISSTSFSNTCLNFPVEKIVLNGSVVENPSCIDAPSPHCSVICNSTTLMGYLQNVAIEEVNEPYYTTVQFQMLFGLMIGAWASQAVVVSLSDAICFKLLGIEQSLCAIVFKYLLIYTVTFCYR